MCPTLSVGNLAQRRPPPGVFPFAEGDGVFRCGFSPRTSFGAHSYFLPRPEGNLLVDGPRWAHELVDGDVLFSGDSLAWNAARNRLTAFRDGAWFSWEEQIRSLARLATVVRFRRVLAGHGWSHTGDPEALHADLLALVGRAEDGPEHWGDW